MTLAPEILAKSIEQIKIDDRRTCILHYTSLVTNFIGIEVFYSAHYWVFFVYLCRKMRFN
jgi:hypothetical protein